MSRTNSGHDIVFLASARFDPLEHSGPWPREGAAATCVVSGSVEERLRGRTHQGDPRSASLVRRLVFEGHLGPSGLCHHAIPIGVRCGLPWRFRRTRGNRAVEESELGPEAEVERHHHEVLEEPDVHLPHDLHHLANRLVWGPARTVDLDQGRVGGEPGEHHELVERDRVGWPLARPRPANDRHSLRHRGRGQRCTRPRDWFLGAGEPQRRASPGVF